MMKVDELIHSAGAAPPENQMMPTPQSVEELTKLYYEIYVPGLCQFFETQWFKFRTEGHNPVSIFLHDKPLISLLGNFLVSLHTVNADPQHTAYCSHLETRAVWAMAKLVYKVPDGVNSRREDPLPDDNASEARNRVFVVETLLNGEYLASNPLVPPPARASDVQRYKEFEFWYLLAESLLQRKITDLLAQQQILEKLRNLLDGRENRDLLYSLVVIRHFGPDLKSALGDMPDHLDERDPKNRLHVACQFLRAEAQPTGGTTNVIRQMAWIGSRAFLWPGYNLGRGNGGGRG